MISKVVDFLVYGDFGRRFFRIFFLRCFLPLVLHEKVEF